jgi:glyoxylate/hydroxypyruvate reductase A
MTAGGPHPLRVVVTLSSADEQPWMDLFRHALPDARVERREPGQPAEATEATADYVVLAEPCRTVFDVQRSPKAVFTASAGVGHLLRLPNLPRAVPVSRLEDAGMAQPMTCYVLAAALRFLLRLDTYSMQQRAGIWEQHDPRLPASVRVGVLGLGVIGGAIARALAAQGFEVRGYAASAKTIAGVQCFAGRDQLAACLDGVDLLVDVLPLTPATTGLLDAKSLALLADGAHVINIGRGATLVDGDLLSLLDSGKLSGATLDVFAPEPLAPTHPFWTHPRVAITPHVSGLTVPEDAVAQIAAKIRKFERGEPVTGLVDWTRGY